MEETVGPDYSRHTQQSSYSCINDGIDLFQSLFVVELCSLADVFAFLLQAAALDPSSYSDSFRAQALLYVMAYNTLDHLMFTERVDVICHTPCNSRAAASYRSLIRTFGLL